MIFSCGRSHHKPELLVALLVWLGLRSGEGTGKRTPIKLGQQFSGPFSAVDEALPGDSASGSFKRHLDLDHPK